jgi:hypothetical protein
MKYYMALAAVLALSTPCRAQVVEELPGVGAAPTAEPAAPAAPAPLEKTTVRWTLKFAPTLAGDLPTGAGNRITDFQTTSAGVALSIPLNPNSERLGAILDFDAGLKADTDFDQDSSDDAGSAVFLNSKITYRRGFRRLNPFAGYGVERGYEDLLDNRTYTDHKLAAGLRVDLFSSTRCGAGEIPHEGDGCSGPQGFAATIIPSVERTFSSSENRERWTSRLAVELSGELINRTLWRLTGTGEVRRFDELGGQNRVDWVANLFAGIDFAKQISPDRRFLREFAIGVRLLTRESNGAADYTRLNILPVLSIGQTF